MLQPARLLTNTSINKFVLALLLTAMIDLWIGCFHPLANAPTINLDRGEVFNTVRAYQKLDRAPQMVLLGSSLMLAPILQSEASFLGAPFPRMQHRRSEFMENSFASNYGKDVKVFCFATGGEMVSDAYLMTKNIVSAEHPPQTIIYGIAPRDFQDNCLPSVESTETFQLFANLNDLKVGLLSPQNTIEQKIDLISSRLSALFRYRHDLKVYMTLRIKKTMESCLPWVMFDKYDNKLELKPRKRGQFPEEAKGTLMVYPGMTIEHYSFQETRFQYIKRYNPINRELVARQFDCFNQLLALCAQKHINVIIVNMPISQFNAGLIPPGFYDEYKNKVVDSCHFYNAAFIDMNKAPFYKDDNFIDGVHLKTEVSQTFLNALAAKVAAAENIAGKNSNM